MITPIDAFEAHVWDLVANRTKDFPVMRCGHKANNYDSYEGRFVCTRSSCFGKTHSGYDEYEN